MKISNGNTPLNIPKSSNPPFFAGRMFKQGNLVIKSDHFEVTEFMVRVINKIEKSLREDLPKIFPDFKQEELKIVKKLNIETKSLSVKTIVSKRLFENNVTRGVFEQSLILFSNIEGAAFKFFAKFNHSLLETKIAKFKMPENMKGLTQGKRTITPVVPENLLNFEQFNTVLNREI
jgi:hypothetical protein